MQGDGRVHDRVEGDWRVHVSGLGLQLRSPPYMGCDSRSVREYGRSLRTNCTIEVKSTFEVKGFEF